MCASLLGQALVFCPLKENLLLKGIKWAERVGRLSFARSLLAALRPRSGGDKFDKVWKILLEGAQLEARAENRMDDVTEADRVCRAVYRMLAQEVYFSFTRKMEISSGL